MARMCPFCQQPPREGQDLDRARVTDELFTPEVLAKMKREKPPTPGLYHCCVECCEILKPGICAKLNRELNREGDTAFTPETLPGNFLV